MQPWVNTLKAAGCKIGPGTWRTWRGLIDRAFAGNVDACAKAASAVPADQRWPDQVEASAKPPDPAADRIRAKYANRAQSITLEMDQ